MSPCLEEVSQRLSLNGERQTNWKADKPVLAHYTRLNASLVSVWHWKPGSSVVPRPGKSLETLVMPSVKEATAATEQINCSKMEAKRTHSKINFFLPHPFKSVLVPEGTAHIHCESSHITQSNQYTSSGKGSSSGSSNFCQVDIRREYNTRVQAKSLELSLSACILDFIFVTSVANSFMLSYIIFTTGHIFLKKSSCSSLLGGWVYSWLLCLWMCVLIPQQCSKCLVIRKTWFPFQNLKSMRTQKPE